MHINDLVPPPRKKNINYVPSSQNRDQSLRTGMLRHVGRDIAHPAGVCRLRPDKSTCVGIRELRTDDQKCSKGYSSFDHWLAAHRNEMFLSSYSGNRLFCKKDLAEALGITRPTLDRWIANGWLEGCTARAFSNGERCYSADAVREALEKLK